FAVGELVRAARIVLEARFGDVRVEGEVSGFKRSGPGHLYFCVKDTQAALDCVMYAREASRLRFQIEDGMTVRLRGRLTIYEWRTGGVRWRFSWRPRRFRGRRLHPGSSPRSSASRASPTWTSSSSRAGEARPRICGASTTSRSRVRSRPAPCR